MGMANDYYYLGFLSKEQKVASCWARRGVFAVLARARWSLVKSFVRCVFPKIGHLGEIGSSRKSTVTRPFHSGFSGMPS